MVQIAPSLLEADFARLGEALRFIKEAGASTVHLDVMDGHFVPELSAGQPVIKSLRKATDLVLDLHLLIEQPERYLADFISIGADRIAIHAEATQNLHRALGLIRASGRKAGLAINPATTVESVADVLEVIDFLLILSADLGFAHPAFLPVALGKVKTARRLREERNLSFSIQVDGGISLDQIAELDHAGADILVAGSDIFQKDTSARWSELMRAAGPQRGERRV